MPVAAALGILLTTTVPAVVACATVNIMLQKKYMSMKEKLQAKLRLDSGIEQLASEFYEEVDITLRASANTVIDTNNNAAYSTVKDLSK